MTTEQTWFITGAGRGMGVDIARAALHAGHAVVATGRDPAKVSAAIGPAEDLLPVALDITDPGAAIAAGQAAADRFGGIDVLVTAARRRVEPGTMTAIIPIPGRLRLQRSG